MLKRFKKGLSLLVAMAMSTVLLSACGGSGDSKETSTSPEPTKTDTPKQTTEKGEPTIIRIGTHWQAGDDPEYKDPVTGESGMAPDRLQAAQKAMETVLNELNVKVQWVQYPSDVRESLLKSVLANDPICEIALMWGGSQGTILGQNVLQPLDEYQSVFSDPDAAWMFSDKIFGHNYLLNYLLTFQGSYWPLVYNMTYLDKVDALKENGKTVYPVDLWKQDKWTWSKFEEYLTKVNEYYANKKSPIRTDVPIKAFQTDYRFTAVQAIHSNGGAVYGNNGLGIDTPEAKKAVEYIDKLISKNIMMSVRYGDDNPVPGWTWNGSDFGNGETVFTNMVPWLSGGAGQSLAKRGESMGVVPFPRPDDIPAGDARYQQVVGTDNQMGILKGVSKEKTELALKAFQLYYRTYYKTLSGSDKALDYLSKNAKAEAINLGFDVVNEQYGEDILKAFIAISGSKTNEYQAIMPWTNKWSDEILGKSIYGLGGSPKYSAAVDSQKNIILETISSTEKVLNSNKTVDNMPPSFSLVAGQIALPAGTDAAKVTWDKYVKAQDGVDGELAIDKVQIDTSTTDFKKVGKYDKGLAVAVKDAAGNEAKSSYSIIIYDPNNKTAPTITAKEELRKIKKDEDASKINWAKDFVTSAVDKDNFDVSSNVKADVSQLDVTTPGNYDVVLTVTDYAGNTAELKITVTVE